jgi:hypothetical protein
MKTYTIIELSVVLMIIAVITAIILPGVVITFQKRSIVGLMDKIGNLHNKLFFASLLQKETLFMLIDREKSIIQPMKYDKEGKLINIRKEGFLDISIKKYNAKIEAILIYNKWERPKSFAIMYRNGTVNCSVILSIKYKDKQYFLLLKRLFGEYKIKNNLSF